MKLGPMIIFLVVIQLTIMFFHSAYTTDSYTLNPYNVSNIVNNTSPSVFEFILDPTGWSGTNLLTTIMAIVGVAGGIAVGVYLVTKSDTILFAGIAAMLLGFGALPIISLYNAFMGNSSLFGCVAIPCWQAIILFGLTGGLIAIMYVLAVLGWWSGRQVS